MRGLCVAPAEPQLNKGFRQGSSTRKKNRGTMNTSASSQPLFPFARQRSRQPLLRLAVLSALVPWMSFSASWAADTTPAQQLQRFATEAERPGDVATGQRLFTQKHGGEWSCASCHGERPLANGRHAGTGKTIAPLAPAANAKSLTDPAKVDKWLRRNCKDVLSRECTAAEKADVLAWLISLKP